MRPLSAACPWGGALLLALFAAAPAAAPAQDIPLDRLSAPPGFTVSLYAGNVPNARAMALGDSGTLFVGSRRAGNVYALVDSDGDGRADRRHLVDSGLELPSGVAFRGGALYVGAVSRILRYDGIEERLDDPPAPVPVTGALPRDRHHGWKYLAFGPDGKLYVPVGAPCNVCEREDPYAAILRMDPDGGGREVFARGVRNSVGFAFHPDTGDLWFTDNGRDHLGDDLPPGELNRAAVPGLHFGFPYCHAGTVPDPTYGRIRDCAAFVPPVQALGPHVAPLGMAFYDGDRFPEDYRGDVFIAEHGSWNRTRKIGYRVTRVMLDDSGAAVGYAPFVEGWLRGQRNWGRPADVLVMPDGAMLISDDQAGAIYRVAWTGSR